MAKKIAQTVVGVLDTHGQAERAMDSLRHAGFSSDAIGLAGPGESLHPDRSSTSQLEETAEKLRGYGQRG